MFGFGMGKGPHFFSFLITSQAFSGLAFTIAGNAFFKVIELPVQSFFAGCRFGIIHAIAWRANGIEIFIPFITFKDTVCPGFG